MNFDDTTRSLRSGQRETNKDTVSSICDAILTPTPGEKTFPILKKLAGPGLVVSDREVLISSENAKFDQKLGVISLNENVVLKFDNLIFKSDKMELFFKDTSNFTENFSNLIKIIAMGNVYFERDQEIIKSDLVSFFPTENKVTITGNVKVVKGKNIGFKSEVLEINLKKDNILN